MASRCPLCRHEFTFGEVFRRWNPFASACPSCGKKLSVKGGFGWAVLFGAAVVPFLWAVFPSPARCGNLPAEIQILFVKGFKIFSVVMALAVLIEWVLWKIGRPGYAPARPQDRRVACFWKFFVVAGLPVGLAVAPTVAFFHWSGVFGKSAERNLQAIPEAVKELKEKKLNLEVSRKIILINLQNKEADLRGEVLACRLLRIHSGLVLLAMGWFLFWSYRMIFHPPEPEDPAKPKLKEGAATLRRAQRKPRGQ